MVAFSRDDQKERFVRDLGANEYINTSKEDFGTALQKLGGAALIVATATNARAISPLLKGLGPLGKLLILAGMYLEMLSPFEFQPLSDSCSG